MTCYNKKSNSLEIICYYTGYLVLVMESSMLIPVVTAIIFREWSAMLDFIISIAIASLVGSFFICIGFRTKFEKEELEWKHGFAIAAFTWIILTMLGAIPYYLSGNTYSFLDACFDVMSGFTTTGLVLLQDLDHISNSLNMWRHLITFVGGQGMIVLGITVMVNKTGGAYKMYVGEGKDIELVPNVKGTARLIWKISIVYLIIGTGVLWLVGIGIGLKPASAFLHALYIFESAWSTGGFAPNSQNIMYYHSVLYESIAMVIFLLGSLNFGLHYAIWQGKRKEIWNNIETRSFFVTSGILSILALMGLSRTNIYPNAISGFRKIIFNVMSAHTTTGFGAVYARQFVSDWGDFGVMVLIVAMLIGGSACSTAGGFKGLRIGILWKGIRMEIKKLLNSERNMRVYKYHHIKDHILTDNLIKSSAIIILCYVITFFIGTMMGTYYGFSIMDAAFESASITGNVGLSIGVTTPDMPNGLKVYYIIAMYLGRLEFLSVFAFIGCLGGIKKPWLTLKKRFFSLQ